MQIPTTQHPRDDASLPLYVYGHGSQALSPHGEPAAASPFEIPAVTHGALRDGPPASHRQLVEAGRQFESYFISYLLKVMRETVHEGALQNKYGAYFHSFYDQEIGQRAAEAGGIGIARMVQEYADTYSSGPGPKAQVLPEESR